MVATTNEFAYSTQRTRMEAPAFVKPEGGLLDSAFIKNVQFSDPLLRGYYFESFGQDVSLDDYTFNPVQGSAADPALGAGEPITLVNSLAEYTVDAVADFNWIELQTMDAQARAQERFENAESIKVEQKFWTQTLAGAATLPRASVAMKPSKAVGFLAEWIGTRFAGVPYFHAGRRVSNEIAAAQLTVLPDDGTTAAKVKGGGVIVNGAGYTDKTGPSGATAATADQAWLYISGTPVLVRSNVVVAPEAPRFIDGNNDRAVVFRKYVPSFDGLVAAVLVDLS